MGAELLRTEPHLEDYFAQAQAASGLPIKRFCLEGPMKELTRTEVAQPALFAIGLALTDAARAQGLRPAYLAGHSLGEYTAAAAAGALSIEDGIELVCLRGRLMAEIQSEHPGAMVAVIGLEDELEPLCRWPRRRRVGLATSTRPARSSFPASRRPSRGSRAGRAGRRRARRLIAAGAAFHSELMQPVQAEMARAAEGAWSDPLVPVAVNADGRIVRIGRGAARGAGRGDREAGPVGRLRPLAPRRRLLRLRRARPRACAGRPRTPDRAGAERLSADSPARLSEFFRAQTVAIGRRPAQSFRSSQSRYDMREATTASASRA